MAQNQNFAKQVANNHLVCWRERIEESIPISKNMSGGNFVQLATTDQNGQPRCRTVVFRGFVDIQGREALRMMTDSRSDKVSQIALSNLFELVWWFPLSNEQYRISGNIELVDMNHNSSEHLQARMDQWRDISPTAKAQFFKPQIPGEIVIINDEDTNSDNDLSLGTCESMSPPDNFVLMLCWPREVKYLRLTDRYAQFDKRNEDGCSWDLVRVNP